MYYFILTILVCVTNYSFYKILKKQSNLGRLIIFCIVFFFATVLIAKIYDFIRNESMPKGGSVFIFLSFSWMISVLYFFKKITNLRVNIAEKLNLEHYLGNITFLEISTFFITIFQLYLIFSRIIYKLN